MIVFCRFGKHPIGSLNECNACQTFRRKQEELTRHKSDEEREHPPLVDASMRDLYRDPLFWQFNYPDPGARAKAQREYEEYEDPEVSAFWESIAAMPDVRND